MHTVASGWIFIDIKSVDLNNFSVVGTCIYHSDLLG